MEGYENLRRLTFIADRQGVAGLLLEERITIAAAALANLSILCFSVLGKTWDIFGLNLCIIASIWSCSGRRDRLLEERDALCRGGPAV